VSGTTVTLTAVPDEGWEFESWSQADIDDPADNPIEVNSTQVTSITATFVEDGGSGSPTDSDGDGVRDEIDECPGTTRGAVVDDVGCPIGSPDDDPDNDGVAGDDDLCPNSPAGAPVDENGCAANERDTDGDGVTDNIDACPQTPTTVEVDEQGCPIGDPDSGDDDEDGVPNNIDQCPNTEAGETVDPNGCADSERDTDGDGVTDDVDQCVDQPGPASNNGCPAGGGGPICGNNALELGEQCDDGNTVSGDGCSSTCQIEGGSLVNNNCSAPTAVSEGTLIYSNVGATMDGPDEAVDCNFFGRGDIRSDIWYCYTATCTGEATISLCGSGYDTKMAVYAGCDCPDPSGLPGRERPLACSDDDCGIGADNRQSRVLVNVTAGQSYMVRVGGFFGGDEQGEGRLTIRCGTDTCVGGSGSCTEAHGDNEPGCETQSCCQRVCEVDTFCCDVTWDSFCAGQAGGFCSATGFPACSASAGDCGTIVSTPGCNDTTCCNQVCQADPYCCITAWDEPCTLQAELICESCGRGRGSCTTARTAPGCEDVECCARVCTADEFCCVSEWDDACVEQALDSCGR
jgi:cysteine-rich repeat protein